MADDKKSRIDRRAYELWQQAGEPRDRDEEFYLQAQREIGRCKLGDVSANGKCD